MSETKPHVQLIRQLGYEPDKILEAARGMTNDQIRDVLPFISATGYAGAKMDAARAALSDLLRERESGRLVDRLGETTDAVKAAKDEIERTRASVESARTAIESTRDHVKSLNRTSTWIGVIAVIVAVVALLVSVLRK